MPEKLASVPPFALNCDVLLNVVVVCMRNVDVPPIVKAAAFVRTRSPLMVIAAVRRRRQLREGWQRLAREDAAERAEMATLLRQPGLMLAGRA